MPAGVALGATLHTVERLFDRVDREHPEAAGDAGLELHLLDPARRRRADIVVVIGLAADHGPEAHDPVVAARLRGVLCHQRQLERAGYLEWVGAVDPGLREHLASAPLELVGELRIERRHT